MKTVLSILAIFLLSSNFIIHGQQKKINFSSKESKGIKYNKKKLLVLWNKVVFNHESSIMKCDSAIYERSNNSFIAYENFWLPEQKVAYRCIIHDFQRAYAPR